MGLYANIILDISHEKIDHPFSYRIPDFLQEQIQPGVGVLVPFGKGDKVRTGYVLEVTDQCAYEESRIKEIQGLSQTVAVEEKLVRLAAWMKEQYGSTMIAALKTVLPVKRKLEHKQKRTVVAALPSEDLESAYLECVRKHQTARARVLAELIQYEQIPYELVIGKLHVSKATLEALAGKGFLSIESETAYRNPGKSQAKPEEKKILSKNQNGFVELVWQDYENHRYDTYLLHGITGSGKTEVYMELISRVVEQGRKVIMLIPEIALTFQTVMRFQKRFGDRVSFINSSLSEGEKYDQCERAKKGEIDIMIGPRSALFTPFSDIGLIVIDEEHESSYKSETMPRFQTVEVARQLASYHQASLILGSATPSLESYYKAKQKEYQLYTLQERMAGGTLPEVHIVDLRKELKQGNRSIFSRKLKALIEDRLEKKEQILLFLNRRGYAGFVSCRMCGFTPKCPHCDVSLSLHGTGKLMCHYCGYETVYEKKCPECSAPYMIPFKAGTQQVEEAFRKEFAAFGDIPILRLDRDTTQKKDSYETILSAFAEEKAQVLIGTQMIVKGHDFKKVTLMGILAADLSLSMQDYRAGERTFQLLTQAAGRAGRGEYPGEVVIQTYQPDHYSIVKSAAQDYESFYQEEILYRQLAAYPPVAHLLSVQFVGEKENACEATAGKLKEHIKEFTFREKILLIGPVSGAYSKLKDQYRFSLTCKAKDREKLVAVKNKIEVWMKEQEKLECSIFFDFDPIHIF